MCWSDPYCPCGDDTGSPEYYERKRREEYVAKLERTIKRLRALLKRKNKRRKK